MNFSSVFKIPPRLQPFPVTEVLDRGVLHSVLGSDEKRHSEVEEPLVKHCGIRSSWRNKATPYCAI